MLSAPSSSSLPYKPHAFPGGPDLSSGRLSKDGRFGGADILSGRCSCVDESVLQMEVRRV
jgi:hypothetical protein